MKGVHAILASIVMVILLLFMISSGSLLWIFPIGIVLWILKLYRDTENYISNGKATLSIGIALLVLGGIYFKLLFSDMLGEITPNSLFLVVILSGSGFVLIIYGEIHQQKGMKYLRYSTIIDKLPGDSLDEIAAAYPKSNDEVCKDLQEMIENGFFQGYHLDLNHRKFISPEKKKSVPVEDMTNREEDFSATKAKVVQCPNCGAVNTLQGGASQCEYCESQLV